MNGQLCTLVKDLAHRRLGPEHDNETSRTSPPIRSRQRSRLWREAEEALVRQLALQGYAPPGEGPSSHTVEVLGGDLEWTLIDCWPPGAPIERVSVTLWFGDRAVHVDSGTGEVAVESLEPVDGRDAA